METVIRLGAFIGIFLVMITLECIKPKRQLIYHRIERWPINLGLGLLNNVLLRIIGGSIAYQTAVMADSQTVGLLNFFEIPELLSVILTLIVLDFAIYAQHVASHKWAWLWRFHQVHHTDLDFDATTAIRFHPIEIIISMAYKVVLILLLGAHANAVIAFEIILNGCAIFNHSNVDLPNKLDRILRWVIITPDVHRIHHSVLKFETDSNYGFSISLWDRLCKTYIKSSKKPQDNMDLGQTNFRKNNELSFFKLLTFPFTKAS